MTWVYEALASALFLGVYDVFKKQSVNGNAVIPTLFISVCCGALIWVPWVVQSGFGDASLPMLQVESLGLVDHLRLLLKSTIVTVSWVLSYFALKHLPVSLAGGIRATGPFWTLLGAVVILSERPESWEDLQTQLGHLGYLQMGMGCLPVQPTTSGRLRGRTLGLWRLRV